MKVSIITVTYNDAKNLEKTLNSILQQDYENIESIIVDGGSVDNSIEIIKNFEKKFKGSVKWISEKDNGLYNAANKGIRMATGDIIGCYWDVYASNDVISKIVKKIKEEQTDGVHGDLVFLNDNKVIRYWKMGGAGKIRQGWMPAHPTLYLKKEVYQKYGLYKENYKCAADYEFMVRCLKDEEIKLSYIPEILIHMFYGGASTGGISAYKQSIDEGIKALRENYVKYPYWITFRRTLKTLLQFVNHK